MYGAIIGDIVGSVYEFHTVKTKDFPLFSSRSVYTDDSVMTIAVARALIKASDEQTSFKEEVTKIMREYGQKYPCAGYGGSFRKWLKLKIDHPYNSFGNGSAMRVSPCALYAVTLQEALDFAAASAEVTHNHPEGIKGAQATAAAVFLARVGKSKDEIREYIEENYYDLSFTLDEIRPTYAFDETCQGSVPQAIVSFLESADYEDTIRNAVSLGGDSDTIAAIAGSIAWMYYSTVLHNGAFEEEKVLWGSEDYTICLTPKMESMRKSAEMILPEDEARFVEEFQLLCKIREEMYHEGSMQEVLL